MNLNREELTKLYNTIIDEIVENMNNGNTEYQNLYDEFRAKAMKFIHEKLKEEQNITSEEITSETEKVYERLKTLTRELQEDNEKK